MADFDDTDLSADELDADVFDGLDDDLDDALDEAEAFEFDEELDEPDYEADLPELDEDEADESLDDLDDLDDEDDEDDERADGEGESTALVEDDDDLLEDLEAVVTPSRELDVDDEVREGEFVCRSCFMAKRESALADEDNLLCRDCV